MIDRISLCLIFFGGAMSWTIAMGQLLGRAKKTFNYMFAGFMFSVGAVQFFNGLLVSGLLPDFPQFAFLHLPFLAWTGPTFFFCFKSVIGSRYRFRLIDSLHALSGLLVIPLLIPFFSMAPAEKVRIIMTPPTFMPGDPYLLFYSGIVAAVVLTVLGYMAFFVKECSFMLSIRFLREKKVSPFLVMIVFLIYPIGFLYTGSVVAANFMDHPAGFYIRAIQILSVLSFFLTLIIYTMSMRDNNYFQVLRQQTEKSRYEKSKIKNLDLDLVASRLRELLEDEKLYCDEDLNLNSLARELEIEPYQLSQIINEHYGKNFNAFINGYRIEEAKRMLVEETDRTIVSVSYAVGFNSPAPFYEWFFKITGSSPSKYRKKMSESPHL